MSVHPASLSTCQSTRPDHLTSVHQAKLPTCLHVSPPGLIVYMSLGPPDLILHPAWFSTCKSTRPDYLHVSPPGLITYMSVHPASLPTSTCKSTRPHCLHVSPPPDLIGHSRRRSRCWSGPCCTRCSRTWACPGARAWPRSCCPSTWSGCRPGASPRPAAPRETRPCCACTSRIKDLERAIRRKHRYAGLAIFGQ